MGRRRPLSVANGCRKARGRGRGPQTDIATAALHPPRAYPHRARFRGGEGQEAPGSPAAPAGWYVPGAGLGRHQPEDRSAGPRQTGFRSTELHPSCRFVLVLYWKCSIHRGSRPRPANKCLNTILRPDKNLITPFRHALPLYHQRQGCALQTFTIKLTTNSSFPAFSSLRSNWFGRMCNNPESGSARISERPHW